MAAPAPYRVGVVPDDQTAPCSPGTPVLVEMQKWGGGPHWRYQCLYLGADDHGWWLGIPAGTHMSRPGAVYVNPVPQVCLAPYGAGWLATWHAPGGEISVYVDMATPALWTPTEGAAWVLRAVDLDLDVVRGLDGEVWVDDEEEFAQHRRELGYPAEIVALATSSCERVRGLVQTGAAPFDETTPALWLARM